MIARVPIASLHDYQLRKLWNALRESLEADESPAAAHGLLKGLATEGRLRMMGRPEHVTAIALPLDGEDTIEGATDARADLALWCRTARGNYVAADEPEVAQLFDAILRALVRDEKRIQQARRTFAALEVIAVA